MIHSVFVMMNSCSTSGGGGHVVSEVLSLESASLTRGGPSEHSGSSLNLSLGEEEEEEAADVWASADANTLRAVRQLTFQALADALPPSEVDEVRQLVGRALVDENEDLMREADALAEILGDVQMQNAALVARQKLADEPARRLAVQHVTSLLEGLHRAVAKSTQAVAAVAGDTTYVDDPTNLVRIRERQALGVETDANTKQLYEYVLAQPVPPTGGCGGGLIPPGSPNGSGSNNNSAPSSRPSTRGSLRTPPSRPQSARSGSGASSARPPSARAAELAPQVSVSRHDAAAEKALESVRAALAEEKEQLLDDIAYLHICLEDETDRTMHVQRAPPPVAALQRWGDELARAVSVEEERAEHEERVADMLTSHASDSARGHRGHVRRLRHVVEGTRPSTSDGGDDEAEEKAAASPNKASVADVPPTTQKVPSPPTEKRDPSSASPTTARASIRPLPRAARRHRAAAAAAAAAAKSASSPSPSTTSSSTLSPPTLGVRLYGADLSRRLKMSSNV